MPVRRRKQSNAMLYTLITFVGLFIAATAVAVIYYVKAEEHRTGEADAKSQLDDYADSRERQTMGAIVGARDTRTWVGAAVHYLDQTMSLVAGGVPENTSAEVKFNNADTEVSDALKLAQEHVDVGDPNNRTGLVQVVKALKAELDNTIKAQLDTQKQLSDLQTRFKNADEANFEKDQTLLAEKDKLEKQVGDFKQKYEELSELLEQTTSQQVQTLQAQLDQERANLRQIGADLEDTRAILKQTRDDLKSEKAKLSKIEPGPDREVQAYQPDGNIILIDDMAGVVHLNIGSNEHVYRGLTFTVYDRGTSIPEDGEGKAEIKVFDVQETYSAARITPSELNKPILRGDIIANLIWDKDRTNVFVVVGDFDLDNDGLDDYDGVDKIKARIEKWGGRVDDVKVDDANGVLVSIDTDFVVLGEMPQILQRPSLDELEVDPRAMQKYEDSLKALNRYNQVRSQAEALWIPIFTYERFLYFIGYKAQAGLAGAF